ncbi:DUF885 domain-containing protein [Sphingosinicella rhizophila]|uniref:DUF885 domain-containing protein n=1 Tax=Sphingosinicella rhizophila TaxID=3050082 RepID=A0ABU3Q618_9SPHN|nr:DUF885 domain-containing protein [Sphingosinicella sp. GR2756]MDT9598854.1 DUF885 domain-containing protein [Sphingosinicella sp. GR2756]
MTVNMIGRGKIMDVPVSSDGWVGQGRSRRTGAAQRAMRLATAATLSIAGIHGLPAIAAIAQAAASNPQAEAETARINAWFDAKYEEQLGFSPMTRSYGGDRKDNDKFDDMSEAGMARVLEWKRKSVEELKSKFDRSKLTAEGKLSYDLWIEQYDMAAAAHKFRRSEYVITSHFGPQTMLTRFLLSVHTVSEPSDMDGYIARISGISRALLQNLERAKINAAAGARPPQFSFDGVIEQSTALSSGAPFGGEGDNAVWTDAQAEIAGLVKAGKIDQAKADRYKAAVRKALIEDWGPAHRQIVAWAQAERPKADVVATGVGKNPNGKAYYAEMLANSTTTDLTAEQIHQIGLDEVARIKGEMEAIKQKVGFEGSLQDFFKYVRDDDRFYYPNTDEGRQAYIDAATAHLARMKTRLPEFFNILPKADVIVKRVEPYREQAGAPQHYLMASADGTRPGVFYAHLIDMKAMPIPQMEVIAYHEGNPGHHMQFSIARELTNVPKFRTALYYNATQEGWGLYTEKLAKEMGGYQDPYSDFGRLTTEIWRAIRLVVDTGLHSKGWTEQQAVDYFRENSPAAEGQIRAEVRRYILSPGQATGYKIGMIKIEELRRRAETTLGPRFDIKGFHDTILASGQMSLPLLERRVNEWIESRKAS